MSPRRKDGPAKPKVSKFNRKGAPTVEPLVEGGDRKALVREALRTKEFDPRIHCGAKKGDGSGLPCRNLKGLRTTHTGFGMCYKHGGNSPGGKLQASRQMAQVAVTRFALPRQIGPHEALLEEVHRSAGWVAWLEERVRAVEPEALVWGVKSMSREGLRLRDSDVRTSIDNPESLTVAKIEEGVGVNEWMRLLREERRHLVDVCRTAIACGIAERQVKLAEAQGQLIARVIQGVLSDLGVSPDDTRVRGVVRERLQLMAGEVAQ